MCFRYTFLILLLLFTINSTGDTIDNANTIEVSVKDSPSSLILKSTNYKGYSIQERIEFATLALDIARGLDDYETLINSYSNLAVLEMLVGRYKSAQELYMQADSVLDAKNYPELAVHIKNQLGNLLRQKGDYYISVDYFQEALRISENNNYLFGVAKSLNHLGMLYKNLEKIDKAREYYDAALNVSLPNDFHSITIRLFNNIGTLNILENNYVMALSFYNRALIMANKTEDIHSQAIMYNNIGNVYREKGNFKEALTHYSKADSILSVFYNIPLYSLVLRNTGLTYLELKLYDKATDLLNTSMIITKDVGLKSLLLNNYYDRARLNYEMGNFEQSYNDFLSFISLSKDLNNKNLYGQAMLLDERKEESYHINSLYERLKQRNSIIYFFAITLVFLLSGFLLIFYRSNREKKSYINLLKKSLEEKETFASALKKSEEKYSKLIKTMNEGLIMTDEKDIIQFANDKACNILGSDFNLVQNKSIKKYIISKEDIKTYDESFELRKIGVSDQFELQLKKENGEEFWGHFSVSPLLDENQMFYGTVIVLMDVTDSKKSNTDLQEATANLNQKIKQINCLFDISDLTSVPGITFEDILKKSLDIIPNGLKYSHDVCVEIVFGNEIYRSDNYAESPWLYNTPVKIQKKKLGHIKVGYLEAKPMINKDPFQFSEKILIKSIAEKLAQVMETKNMETALSESHEKLFQAQKIAKIGNWEWDLQTGKKAFSESYFDIMGLLPEKRALFDDDVFKEIIHPDDRVEVLSLMHKIYSGNFNEVNSFYRIFDYKGDLRHIRATGKVTYDDKLKPHTLIGTVQDVTEQIINQELKSSIEVAMKTSEMKQQFLANMSHEMRTPMNGILGMIDFLLKTQLSDEQMDYAHTIKHSSESLLNIINDVLDLSKIEAGKLQLKPINFSISEMLEKVKGLFAALTKQKVLGFDIIVDDDVPEYIKADENRLLQIITNLISNAVKFTPDGSVTLKVKLNDQDDNKVSIYVEVSDTGIGIKEESMDKLFQPFSQLDTSAKRTHEGTGLGLSICRNIVKLMNGNIGVKRNPEGKGSTFYFSFNAVETKKSAVFKKKPKKLMDDKLDLKIDVLLVEDKIINQKIIKMMLENAGCRVKLAYNGLQAIEIMEKKTFDLIILDIQMPVMDGVTANKVMREKFDKMPPVIALSANALEGDAERYINEGMDDYISKPVRSEDLYEKILQWVK